MDKLLEYGGRIGIKNGAIIVAVIAIVIIFANFASGGFSNNPEDVVEDLIKYTDDSKWDKSQALVATRIKDFYKAEGANILDGLGQLVYDEGGDLDMYVVKVQESDKYELSPGDWYLPVEEAGETDAALVYADLTFDKGRVTKSWEFNLVKENGKWKVLALNPM